MKLHSKIDSRNCGTAPVDVLSWNSLSWRDLPAQSTASGRTRNLQVRLVWRQGTLWTVHTFSMSARRNIEWDVGFSSFIRLPNLSHFLVVYSHHEKKSPIVHCTKEYSAKTIGNELWNDVNSKYLISRLKNESRWLLISSFQRCTCTLELFSSFSASM